MAAVTDECMSRALWRKSTYSGNGNDCVEAGVAEVGWVLVRDTTNRAAGTLSLPASAWQAFAEGLKQL
jgi:Domain of unknown function (DUF397)